jgi:glycosyltransferase involved in cell wall biosynthesis
LTTNFHPNDWAILAPNNDSGLGRMGEDMRKVLGIQTRLVPSSALSQRRDLQPMTDRLLNVEGSTAHVAECLGGLKGVIAFEKFWHPEFLSLARKLGVKTVCVPMWEWFRGLSPHWGNCDYFACPNDLCLQVVRGYGFNNASVLPWTLDLSRFPGRVVQGAGRHFVHNAGEIDPDDRKGTKDAIAAFAQVQSADIQLTVRTQRVAVETLGDPRITSNVGTLEDPADLYREGDVFIQPSKLEGVGFMVLEAVASGLPVITTNSAPMNQWVQQKEMLAQPTRFVYPSYSSSWVEHAHLHPAKRSSLATCIQWAAQHDLTEVSAFNRDWAETTFRVRALQERWEQVLTYVLALPSQQPIQSGSEPALPCFNLSNRLRQKARQQFGVQLPLLRSPLSQLLG